VGISGCLALNQLEILAGDCRTILPTLEAGSVQTCCTSPPYWGLRDYGTGQWEGGDEDCEHRQEARKPADWSSSGLQRNKKTPELSAGTIALVNHQQEPHYLDECGKCGARRIDQQLGLEETPGEYIANMVAVFREVWRVLRDDGTLWLNMGDCYSSGNSGQNVRDSNGGFQPGLNTMTQPNTKANPGRRPIPGMKPKDLCMMPARVAMALQADGWYLRSDIIWHKPNPMPESVTDRPTKAHEYIFLLTKNGGNPLIWRARDTGEWSYKPDLSEVILFKDAEHSTDSRIDRIKLGQKSGLNTNRTDEQDEVPRWKGFDYFYDADSIKEPNQNGGATDSGYLTDWSLRPNNGARDGKGLGGYRMGSVENGRNKRSVWTIATQPFSEAHFATFPEDLIKPCILAGSRPGDIVFDPFAGSGTVGQVALELGRRAILIELNPDYIELIRDRTWITPGFPNLA
jgi:DNA modification methylase